MTSIGPILAVPGIREALRQTSGVVAAVSPIVRGAAVSGPAGILMASQGLPVSIAGLGQAYADFLDVLVVDSKDAEAAEAVRKSGFRVHCTETIMRTASDKEKLAKAVMEFLSREDTTKTASGTT
ncbi:MAG: hypothetical protein DMG68_21025 [Acidobacteria bacterium]|nr:MAG: hypothetical protein DMG68_21025 [Acidobacteriota bacterium]